MIFEKSKSITDSIKKFETKYRNIDDSVDKYILPKNILGKILQINMKPFFSALKWKTVD